MKQGHLNCSPNSYIIPPPFKGTCKSSIILNYAQTCSGQVTGGDNCHYYTPNSNSLYHVSVWLKRGNLNPNPGKCDNHAFSQILPGFWLKIVALTVRFFENNFVCVSFRKIIDCTTVHEITVRFQKDRHTNGIKRTYILYSHYNNYN